MLCEVSIASNPLVLWATISVLGLASVGLLSGACFYALYVKASYETWRHKTNAKYPSPRMVRAEVVQTVKGIATASVCPALSIYLAQSGHSQAFCGTRGMDGTEYSAGYIAGAFFVSLAVSDLFEWWYHYVGHLYDRGWEHHKHHHKFYNPSPFAVIADSAVDQFVRATPLLVFPLVMPINVDLLFAMFGAWFYGYGVYLHSGHEFETFNAHTPIWNTSYHHYAHHAISIKNKPLHTGFFVRAWDQMAGSVIKDKCFCAKCAREQGKRSREEWAKVEVPDYSVLLRPTFWMGALSEGLVAPDDKKDL